jgi:hypothetical protein
MPFPQLECVCHIHKLMPSARHVRCMLTDPIPKVSPVNGLLMDSRRKEMNGYCQLHDEKNHKYLLMRSPGTTETCNPSIFLHETS